MQLSSALRFLVAVVILVGSLALQPTGNQNVAIAAVTEARDELKLVVQQLGEQQEQINQLTKEVAELRAAKTRSPAASGAENGTTSYTVAPPQPNSSTTSTKKVLASLRATAERAEHVLVDERPRTPWWAEKQHTRGPAEFPSGGGYYGESNTDATFGRHKYYPAGWSVDPKHRPRQMDPFSSSDASSAWNVYVGDPLAPPPSPSPPQLQAVPTLAPIVEEAPPPPVPPPPSAADSPHTTSDSDAAPPPPPSGNELRPKSTQLARPPSQPPPVQLKNTMGFFGPPPSGTLPNAPASA